MSDKNFEWMKEQQDMGIEIWDADIREERKRRIEE